MGDWEINRPLGICFGTQRQIEPGDDYYAALVRVDEGFERRDFCTEYWEGEKPEVFCYWKTKLPHPDQKKQMFVDDEMLMAFFERLAEATEKEKLDFRFVLMLILMRKRRLKYDSTRIDGGKEIWSLKVVGGKETVEVENPHLDEEQIEQLSSQIGQVLHADMQE